MNILLLTIVTETKNVQCLFFVFYREKTTRFVVVC